jgi:hypothetical protein
MKNVCTCNAYEFPHRENGGKCEGENETLGTEFTDGEQAYADIRADNAAAAARECQS